MQQRQMWRSTQTRPEPGRAIVVVNEDGTLARIAQFVRDDEGEWVVNDVDGLHCELFGDYAYWTYFDFPEDQRDDERAELSLTETLWLARGIVRQHNLLSTATDQERRETVERLVRWWNLIAFPALTGKPIPEWAKPLRARLIADLRAYAARSDGDETGISQP
jgi:hypothetical protein